MSEDAFREMDRNSDGKVTEEEFLAAVMSQQNLASLLTLKIVQVFDPDLE